jgi:hypothetical protein
MRSLRGLGWVLGQTWLIDKVQTVSGTPLGRRTPTFVARVEASTRPEGLRAMLAAGGHRLGRGRAGDPGFLRAHSARRG